MQLIPRLIILLIALFMGLSSGRAQVEPFKVVVLGDSLTAGYGLAQDQGFTARLQNWMYGVGQKGVDIHIINAGVSGDTSAGGLARLDWALEDGTDGVMVILGGNDLLRGLPPTETRKNLSQIIEKIQGKGLPVLLVGMPGPANYGPEYKVQFDAIYPELAATYKTLFAPNFFAGLVKAGGSENLGDMQKFMQPDGLHPNAEGVELIVNELGPFVITLMEQTYK